MLGVSGVDAEHAAHLFRPRLRQVRRFAVESVAPEVTFPLTAPEVTRGRYASVNRVTLTAISA